MYILLPKLSKFRVSVDRGVVCKFNYILNRCIGLVLAILKVVKLRCHSFQCSKRFASNTFEWIRGGEPSCFELLSTYSKLLGYGWPCLAEAIQGSMHSIIWWAKFIKEWAGPPNRWVDVHHCPTLVYNLMKAWSDKFYSSTPNFFNYRMPSDKIFIWTLL